LELKNLPEINFVTMTLDEVIDKNVKRLEQIALEVTGEAIILYPGHKWRVMVHMLSLIEHQQLININEKAKNNLLRYSDLDMTKHIGARTNTFLIEASKSETMIEVILSKVFEVDYLISAGTLFTSGNNVYFENLEDIIFLPGETSKTFKCLCVSPGTIGNDFLIGQIDKSASNLPFVSSIKNTVKSFGGADEEELDNFKERIRLSPSTYNTAGSDAAYIAMAKNYSAEVSDVYVYSSAAETVDVIFLMASGIPSAEDIAGMTEYLSDKSRRPLNDKVQCAAPSVSNYTISYTYYIASKDSLAESEIKLKVQTAVEAYKAWQRGAIGRNINPSKLHNLIIEAGASRVVIASPLYKATGETEVANCTGVTETYGGLENDGS